ncbi:hypothetical protein EJ04DRAFT_580036 [Polyplosphaeria fusca]|uniref:Uncharacterized protein n=1 Tax=Polyplosphaeria fusca TaxID=682080 RepID=A0A9P4QRP3_9PLEO|nr:hypothetical protein EJ04DRAFT_580036 [Polyplosphaeria fusca]
MTLSTEVRLMIFRHLLPSEVGCERRDFDDPKMTLFKINRQIKAEAYTVLYEEALFEASLIPRGIHFAGRWWQSDETMGGQLYPMSDTFKKTPLNKVHKMKLIVEIREMVNSQYSHYPLSAMRDHLRRFLGLIGQDSCCRHLEICPKVYKGNSRSIAEAIAVVWYMLEPLKKIFPLRNVVLHPMKFDTFQPRSQPLTIGNRETGLDPRMDHEYHKQYAAYKWDFEACMLDPKHSDPDERIQRASVLYGKIEKFGRDLESHYYHVSGSHRYMDKSFISVDRDRGVVGNFRYVLTLSLEARENGDVETLHKIQDVLFQRWILYQKNLQAESWPFRNAVVELMAGRTDVDARSFPSEVFDLPDNFTPDYKKENDLWPDLKRHDVSAYHEQMTKTIVVIVSETRERRFFEKDGEKWSILKTPTDVRVYFPAVD